MGSFGRLGRGRARWLAIFTLLVLAISTAPVLADPSGEVASDTAPQSTSASSEGEVPLPDAEDIQEGIEAVELREAAQRKWLASAEALSERKASRSAYVDLSADEAQDLLLEVFAKPLEQLDSDPARFLSEVKILKSFGDSAATISEDGDTSLLEANIPIRSEDEGGEERKVDLSLQATAAGFEPANPLVDLHIPQSAAGDIEVGDGGLSVSPLGVEEQRSARTLGEKDVFYPEVQPDTDLIVSPIAAGVEIFNQLRSPESPEELRYKVDLPEGATLRESSIGGAEVLKGEEVVAVVPFPTAVDAQGTEVAVELRVEADTLVLSAPHRQEDLAYPILVDPAIYEGAQSDWYGGGNLAALDTPGIWQWNTNSGGWVIGGTWCLRAELCSPSGRGLFVSSLSGRNMPANVFGQWAYGAPGQTGYIPSIYPERSVYINPFWRHNYNCSASSYPYPLDYNGMWDGSNWTWFETNRAQWYGDATMFSRAKTLIFGMNTGTGGNIPCWRNIMAGGVAIRLADPEAPTINSVSGIPTGWVGDRVPFTVTANVSDPGLGVRNVSLSHPGIANPIHYTPTDRECPGTRTRPCPSSLAAQFSLYTDQFDQGKTTATLSAYDYDLLGHTSAPYQWHMYVDKTSPDVYLDGQLARATREAGSEEPGVGKWDELSLPVYNLTLDVRDGSNATDADKRSGVRSVEVFIDDARAPDRSWQNLSCPASSCPLNQTYTLQLHDLSADRHFLRVLATDFVGNQIERRIEFEYIPATGIKDEYVMQYFPLTEDEEDLDAPELAVNLMNGNLVYHEQDVDVTGPAVDLEVERYYNSQLPEEQNTEWGDGWTLAQTPELDPEETQGPPEEADLLDTSGATASSVDLPTEAGREEFNPELQATLEKEASGGYELTDASGETNTAIVFDSTGQAEALRTDGYAKVDYVYDAGALAAIAVDDPASTTDSPYSVRAPPYSTSLGASGSGNGQLSMPLASAVDAEGDIWVVDRNNNRVQKFSPDGAYLDQFGTYGSREGQLSTPSGIAIDSNGDIWVSEFGNSRVQKFDSEGNFLSVLGRAGSGNGQFANPFGIAFDSEGNILIGDAGNHRIQIFRSDGAYLDQFGSSGAGNGQFNYPFGVAVDDEDNIWVADTHNSRVQKFDSEGAYLDQFGSSGSGESQFNYPVGIALGPKDSVWVADLYRNDVQIFDSDGTYLDKFGSYGSGEGQFYYPAGITFDSKRGRAWIADAANGRVQGWGASIEEVVAREYFTSLGTPGSGNGQLSMPYATALDSEGNIWVTDSANNRVQKFSPDGAYLDQFGTYGSREGQLITPSGIAIDSNGDIWVSEFGNSRVQKFDSQGNFLALLGGSGSGNGQFSQPYGIAFTSAGDIVVGDAGNKRIQLFRSDGTYLDQFGTYGSGNGQFSNPYGVAVDSEDNIWVADTHNARVQKFDSDGTYQDKFGSYGSGEGQFNYPVGIALGPKDSVWVADLYRNDVQIFDSDGTYLDKFGGIGSGEEQLYFPVGITFNLQRDMAWIADAANGRVQGWVAGYYSPQGQVLARADDPAVAVDVVAGLVESVEGADAGEHTYEHDGELLTSHEGPEGEAQYRYANDDMTGIELPDGTTATITYTADGRVRSITVDLPSSDPRTTYFYYQDDPRETTVSPPDAPNIVYEIGDDGSIFKWSNVGGPPEMFLAGSLYAYKETESPISTGDHNLLVNAHSDDGIASIEVVANGNLLVDEAHFEQDLETREIEHISEESEWVTATENHAPGILQLEAIVTDTRGESASERFWVNIPYTPPPPPEAPARPRFAEILRFREDYGLDLDLRGNEIAINNRIFNLIGDWHSGDPVARATMERWGVPLRTVDVAELEYRQRYIAHNGPLIDHWGRANASSSYAGYYIDHPSGGKIRIGFVADQSSNMDALKNATRVIAHDRLAHFALAPTTTLSELESMLGQVRTLSLQSPTIFTSWSINIQANSLLIGTTDTEGARLALAQLLGPEAPVVVQLSWPEDHWSLRIKSRGQLLAGDQVSIDLEKKDRNGYSLWADCTAGFGAYEKLWLNGAPYYRSFFLFNAHCSDYQLDRRTWRGSDEIDWHFLGKVRRSGWTGAWDSSRPYAYKADVAAVRVYDSYLMPQSINAVETDPPLAVGGINEVNIGTEVCHVGINTTRAKCGDVLAVEENASEAKIGETTGVARICFNAVGGPGDSGGPVWINGSPNQAIGLVTGPSNSLGRNLSGGRKTVTCYVSLLPSLGVPLVATALGHPGMGSLQVRYHSSYFTTR